MSTEVESLLPTLLTLSERDRLWLADQLYESVHDGEEGENTQTEWEEAWVAEAERRFAASTPESWIPGEEVMKRLREKHG